MDAVLVANEAVDSRVKQNKPGILCKLDVEQAYDHVNWGFLLEILNRMDFGSKWINWIRHYISTVCFSVLIKGSPVGFFKAGKGLGQCDFLFILAMEGLNNMVKKAKHIGWIDGSEIERRDNSSMEITHLLYEDDTQIFCDAKVDQLKFLRVILVLFLVCILIGAKAHCIQLMQSTISSSQPQYWKEKQGPYHLYSKEI